MLPYAHFNDTANTQDVKSCREQEGVKDADNPSVFMWAVCGAGCRTECVWVVVL